MRTESNVGLSHQSHSNAFKTIGIKISWARIALSLVLAGAGFAPRFARAADVPSTQPSATDESNQALQKRIDVLENRVDQLQGANGPASGNPAVDSRQQFFSGYDPSVGFVLRSEDGAFSFHPGIVLDFRDLTDYRQNVPRNNGSAVTATGDDTETGFEISRARLTFDGNFTHDFTYFVQLQADEGATPGLLDAYLTYHFPDNSPFALKVGQFKDPIWHERNLSEANLMAVDRTLLEDLLGGGQTSRVQGASLIFSQNFFRSQTVLHNGFDSLNTKFFQGGGLGTGIGGGAGVTPTNYGASERVEFSLLNGHSAFSEYDRQFTALGDTKDVLVLGGGADFSQAGPNGVLFHTVDLQYDNTAGLSAYVAYLGSYRDLKNNQGVAPGFSYDPGFEAQVAYLVTPKIEPFARYDYTYLQGNTWVPGTTATDLATGEVQEITLGANFYMHKQNVKFTLDGSWLPNGSPLDAGPLGILKDSSHEEFLLRAQIQLAL